MALLNVTRCANDYCNPSRLSFSAILIPVTDAGVFNDKASVFVGVKGLLFILSLNLEGVSTSRERETVLYLC